MRNRIHLLSILFALTVVFGGCEKAAVKEEKLISEETGTGEEESETFALQGTKWKLAGLMDVETGDLRELEPKDCEECFTFYFYTDSTAQGKSTINWLRLSLSPVVEINILTCVLDAPDGDIYTNTLTLINAYTVNKDSLKLYYNDDKNYLLYRPLTINH